MVTHVPDGGSDIRKVQELLDHRDVRTTMIYDLYAGPESGWTGDQQH
ncbi:hypothetical protein [Candidatus Methylomirabilis sp.]